MGGAINENLHLKSSIFTIRRVCEIASLVLVMPLLTDKLEQPYVAHKSLEVLSQSWSVQTNFL